MVLRILSMGWGRQTWTMAAMMALGEMERADYIVHADTTHEHEGTYQFRQRWEPWLGEHGLNVVTVQGSNTEIVREDWSGAVMIPGFTVDKHNGEPGQVRRQCTHDWKIMPIRKFLRTLLPKQPDPGSVQMQMGISLDEYQRMRTSDVAYIENTYPLVDMRWTRADCLKWLDSKGLPIPPKSSCVFCPYKSVDSWRQLKRAGGNDWEKALTADLVVRDKRPAHGSLYIHPGRKPLDEAVSIPEDVGAYQLGFEPEQPCDSGYCFV